VAANEVVDTSGNAVEAGILGSFSLSVDEAPAVGSSLRIEAEDYKAGTNGVEYFDTTAGNGGGEYRNDDVDIEVTSDAGGGFNIGYMAAGEYLTYEANLASTGTYDVTLRLASAKSKKKKVNVTVDGQTYTLTVPGATGGWQSYQDFTISDVALSAGVQEIQVAFPNGKLNFNYIDIVPQGVAGPDTTVPTASLQTTSLTLPVESTDDAEFVVEYSDDVALNVSSLGNQDLVVTGPFGVQSVTFAGINVDSNGAVRQATYAIAAPAGGWDPTDAGSYSVALVDSEVTDTSDNAVAAGSLGSIAITVEEPTPDDVGPVATLETSSLTLPADSTSNATFVVQYSDETAVDIGSLDSQDLVVTGPDGTQTVAFIGVDINS
ncbi:MAG: carbohydrate-binding domain-containing protein, partial [Cyanobacteria bacterium J06576_12]